MTICYGQVLLSLLRRSELHRQSSGYEPDELLLLYPAIDSHTTTSNNIDASRLICDKTLQKPAYRG